MAKVSPWYSKKQKDVYHDNTDCDKGNNIESENIAYGTGGLPKVRYVQGPQLKRLGLPRKRQFPLRANWLAVDHLPVTIEGADGKGML